RLLKATVALKGDLELRLAAAGNVQSRGRNTQLKIGLGSVREAQTIGISRTAARRESIAHPLRVDAIRWSGKCQERVSHVRPRRIRARQFLAAAVQNAQD